MIIKGDICEGMPSEYSSSLLKCRYVGHFMSYNRVITYTFMSIKIIDQYIILICS